MLGGSCVNYYSTEDLIKIWGKDREKGRFEMSKIINALAKKNPEKVKFIKDENDKRKKLYDRDSAINIMKKAFNLKEEDIKEYRHDIDLNLEDLAHIKEQEKREKLEQDKFKNLETNIKNKYPDDSVQEFLLELINDLKNINTKYKNDAIQAEKRLYEIEGMYEENLEDLRIMNHKLHETNIELIKKIK